MINDDDDYDDDGDDDDDDGKNYFAVKRKIELYSSEWLRSKKQSITNVYNCFKDALNDVLDYQRIKKPLKKISKRKPHKTSITGKI